MKYVCLEPVAFLCKHVFSGWSGLFALFRMNRTGLSLKLLHLTVAPLAPGGGYWDNANRPSFEML